MNAVLADPRALPAIGSYLTNGRSLVLVVDFDGEAVWVEDAVTFRERKLAAGRLYRSWRPVEYEPLPLPEHLTEG